MRHTQVAIERNWARKVWTLSDKLIVKWMLCNLDLLPLGTLWVLLLTLDAIGKKVRQRKNSQRDRKKLQSRKIQIQPVEIGFYVQPNFPIVILSLMSEISRAKFFLIWPESEE